MDHGRSQDEPKNKKRKLSASKETITRTFNDDLAPYLYVLVVSLKDEPTFFYVPLAEYKVHKSLLKSLALMDLEDDEMETLEKQWQGVFESWYDNYTDFDDDIVNIAKRNISIVKVVKLINY
jgi:hypothetical protein